MKKLLIFFVFCTGFLLSNCSENKNTDDGQNVSIDAPGKSIYIKSCRLCHGNDGNLGLSGAANLKISALNLEEIKVVVSEGRKSMPGWKNQLTPEEIQQVSEYVITLKK